MPEPTERARSYRVVLPPTWVMLPVGQASNAAIDALADSQFGAVPAARYGASKQKVVRSLRALAESARTAGGIDMIFPTVMPWQVPVSAGIVISEIRSAAPSADAVSAVMEVMLRARPGAAIVETRAGAALREVVDQTPDDAAAVETLAALRSVFYTWPVPGASGTFLVAAFTVSGQTIPEFTPIVDALTELNDMMMETLVWA